MRPPEYRSGSPPSAIASERFCTPAMAANDVDSAFQSRKSRNDRPLSPWPVWGLTVACELTLFRTTIRFASAYGSGRSSTPSTTLKIVVFSPMPNPRHKIATAANGLACQSPRRACRTSWDSTAD